MQKKSLSVHRRTTLSGYIFATEARIDNGKKLVKHQYLPHMPLQYGELGLLMAEICCRVWGTPANLNGFRVSHLGSVTARYSSSGRQPNYAVFNRRCHLYSAGRRSRWALAHILVLFRFGLRSSYIDAYRISVPLTVCIQVQCYSIRNNNRNSLKITKLRLLKIKQK